MKAKQMLEELLTVDKANPLTMLLQSPNPYRGIGVQIKIRLEAILKELSVDNLPLTE